MPAHKVPLELRFWTRMVRQPNGCWEWPTNQRYGNVWTGASFKTVHRVAWELVNGPIPDDLHVLHHCDNGKCANPVHLYLGTPLDNARDVQVRHRRATKLTAQQVQAIRSSSGPLTHLARAFGVSLVTIRAIRHRKSWRYL